MPGPGFNQPAIAKASPPTIDPRLHPGIVPGADVEPGMPGPGFPGGGPPKAPPFDRVESIDIIDGKYIPCENPYAEIIGEIGDTSMENVTYKTDTPCLNGIYIAGDCKYEITGCNFDLKGNGIDDFAGIGAAVMVDGESELAVTNTNVVTEGVIRPCTAAGGNSTFIVRNCVLESKGGTIPESYVPRIASGMMEPPPGLKIGGNCRTHLSTGNSRAYFYDSKIIAQSWAALSTDSSHGDLHLEANNCDVICHDIGYAVYADNGCYGVLNNCRVKTATHSAIIAGESSVAFNDCDVVSGQYCTLAHSVRGSTSEVTVATIKGGSFDIGEDLILIRSTNMYINIDGAKIKTGKTLLHSVVNDDGAATKVEADEKLKVYGIKAVLSNMDLEGDFIHEDTDRAMSITMINNKLKGKIQDAYISLENSKWTATGDSSVCLIGNMNPGDIDALSDVTITAKAGEGCLLSGEYTLASGGKMIVL